MGEIADMMIGGALCETCGAYVGDEVGYPRKCRSCKPKKERKSKPKTYNQKPFYSIKDIET